MHGVYRFRKGENDRMPREVLKWAKEVPKMYTYMFDSGLMISMVARVLVSRV